MALPNPSFEPETHRWRPGAWVPSWECPPKFARFWAKKQPIFAQNSPQKPGKTPKRRETVAGVHVRLDFTVSKSPLVRFNSTICPRYGPKKRQKAPKFAQCAPTPQNQARAGSSATWLKIRFKGHLVHPQPPTFCGFQASESPNEPPRPPYQWSLVGAGGQHSPHTGQQWVHLGPRGEKNHFFQSCS